MPPAQTPSLLQRYALQSFTALHQLNPNWAGRLILSMGLDESGAALSVAGNIAGAVSLAIEDDVARIRKVVRNGAADFVVNSLDEAIRAMKNEIRKQAPLSVALQADPDRVLEEILERGLAPDVFSCFDGRGRQALVERACLHFVSLGAQLIDFQAGSDHPSAHGDLISPADTLIARLVAKEHWTMVACTFPSQAELHGFDALALSLLPSSDILRRRWLEGAPRILQRERPPHRLLWLTGEEQDELAAAGFAVS